VTWDPKALWYAASDTTIALAIQGADRLIAANFVPDSAGPSYNWQGARLQYQMAAIACMPAYRTKNITRGYGARWSTADTSRATVTSSGFVTVKRQGAVTVTVRWP
jgi:hypothetical protein